MMNDLFSNLVFACATCYGAANSPLTQGANAAILFLLTVTGGVFGGILAFVFSLKKRAKMIAELALNIKRQKKTIHD